MAPYLIQYPFDEVRASYHSPVVRMYCRVRMHILRQRILAEIGQYIPLQGHIAEFGCGFGLFSLCIASSRANATLHACDLSPRRIEMARNAATSLNIRNVTFHARDARDFVNDIPDLRCAYMFDLLHHIPRESVRGFVRTVWEKIAPGGLLIIKDVDASPPLKMAFTYTLDVLMTRGRLPDYWSVADMLAMLSELGGETRVHVLDDYLPFPHRLYTLQKPKPEARRKHSVRDRVENLGELP